MSDNHLVKRLRDFAGCDVSLINEVADRIEALEQKLGKESAGKAGWRKVADRLQKRIWTMEAALRDIANWHSHSEFHEGDLGTMADFDRRTLEGNRDQTQAAGVVAPTRTEAN